MKMNLFSCVSLIVGVLCLLYFILVAVVGHGTYFFMIWGIAGSLFFTLSYAVQRGWLNRFPLWLKVGVSVIFLAGLLILLAVEGCILSGFRSESGKEADYVLVLGAQLKQNGPSRTLQMRLNAAYTYAEAHGKVKVIVSGGQGYDEPNTEAQGMYEYLVQKGMEPERIIREDKSENTHENIVNSSVYLNMKQDEVRIVTSDFHVFRALQLAKAAGYDKATGIPARSDWYMLPNNMLREGFALIKDFLVGNLSRK